MQPLQKLLSRIQWDAEFGRGAFALGYHDRVAGEERIAPLASVRIDAASPGMLLVSDERGQSQRIPLHRVHTVYKDGVVIWQRPAARPAVGREGTGSTARRRSS
jgi:uncharacterized protein (UPF0248 family)